MIVVLNESGKILLCVSALALTLAVTGGTVLGQPVPIGTSTITVTYETTAGEVSFSGDRDYLPNAGGPGDATVLGAARNIRAFNSVNSFGRRAFLANSNPLFAGVLLDDESMITHAFFKNVPADIAEVFFPDLIPGGSLTITVGPINFAEPVRIDETTLMLHALWSGDQADLLPSLYINLHNHHTQSVDFRDLDDFLAGGVFSNFPVPNYVLGDLAPVIAGNGTTSLNLSLTIPYDMLENLEETGQTVPAGLPAPQGFLEPFHFHIEYTVAPAPVTGVPTATLWSLSALVLIIATSATIVLRRRGVARAHG